MRARFASRLSALQQTTLVSILAGMTLISFPAGVSAYDANKTPLVFEIKSFPKITIPEVAAAPITIEEDPIKIETNPETGKVYMHEPSIKAYVCPKLGDKCKTFIAILKAENGTHECTRDNKGLNRNGSIDVGLAQINWSKNSPYTMEQLRDCKFNLDIALQKYDARGFSPWVAYTSGRYKKHLKYIN
ncbi:MAG: hypothetical protein HYV13_02125 [Candidatus Doudnabacteria bacterium]|nr:hypothetical protein [Candidatus Doudnabacteria bacterium]